MQKSQIGYHFCRQKVRDKGFSLVEVVVVLVILSILTFFVAPDLFDWKDKMQLKGNLDDLFADMQKAKIHAIKNNVSVDFNWYTGSGTFAGNNCKNYGYRFVDSAGFNVTQDREDPKSGSVFFDEGVCITANNATGEGFTSRGLPKVTGGVAVTLQNKDIPTIKGKVRQTVAGGVKLDIFKGTDSSNL